MRVEPETPLQTNLRTLGMFFLATLLCLLLYLLRGVLAPLIVAFLVAYALDPAVDKLETWKVPRAVGAALIMLLISGVLVVFLTFAVPALVDELRAAGEDLPEQIARLESRMDPWLWSTMKIHAPRSFGDLAKNLQMGTVAQATSTAVFGTLSYVGVVLSAMIIPVFALYLLIDFDRIVARVAQMVPRRWVSPAGNVASEIHQTLGGWVRGQVTACIVNAALYSIGLRIVDIRLAVPIGILTGLLAFIPYIGFGFGLTLALSMAVLDWNGLPPIVGVLAVMGGVQLLDGLVTTPRIVGRSVGLSALEVLLTMMAAGTLFGFLGVLLAVPLGAVSKIIVRRAVRAYTASRFYLRTARH